jgi:hypothetical protein
MQQHKDILSELDFGFDVAENDINLENYFVETEDFSKIKSGDVDVIRAHKGLGKSAIFKMLISGAYKVPDTIIVNGSDATSSDIFRSNLSSANNENQYRLLWTAYLSSAVANEVCRLEDHPAYRKEYREIKDFLKALGLGKTESSSSLIERLKRTKSLGIGLGISEDGMPSLNFNVEFDNQKQSISASEEHFIDLMRMCINVLNIAKKKTWILIDRLDELYEKNSEKETLSLRGLLRSHLNICAINGGQTLVRAKIFIRTDIYEKITKKQGFTNITHLRDINIVWSARSIASLASERAIANNKIREILVELKVDTKDPNAVWDKLLPKKIEGRPSSEWIARATSDGTGAYNPRNFITLLSLTKMKTAALVKANPNGHKFDTTLSVDAFPSAFSELSRKRLDDTVLAEFPQTRKYIDQLRGGISSFESPSILKTQLGISINNDEDFVVAVEALMAAGVLKQISASAWSIAYLYRAALRAGAEPRAVN